MCRSSRMLLQKQQWHSHTSLPWVASLGTLHGTTVKGVHPGHWSSNQIHFQHTETNLFPAFFSTSRCQKKHMGTLRPPLSQTQQLINTHEKLVISNCQSLETTAKSTRFWSTSSCSWFHLGYFIQKTIICANVCFRNIPATKISYALGIHGWKLAFLWGCYLFSCAGRVVPFHESDLVSNNVRRQWEESHFAWNPLALPARMGNKSHVLFLHVQTQHVQSMCYIITHI